MSKKLPFYKMYPADFDTDENARLLDMHQAGLYLFCLNHAWSNACSLPADEGELARIFKMRASSFKKLWERVSKCFMPHPSDQSRIVNKRQWEEYCSALESSEAHARAGKTGGRPKQTITKEEPNPFIRASGSESESVRSYLERKKQEQQSADVVALDFPERVGAMYHSWKKMGRQPLQVIQQYVSAIMSEGHTLDEIEDGVFSWATYCGPVGWRYCPLTLAELLTSGTWKITPPDPATSTSGTAEAMRLIYKNQLDSAKEAS